jgi:hypothetical protein
MGAVMSGWLFAIAIVIFASAVMKRGQRADDRENELIRLEHESRATKFWGLSNETQDEAHKGKVEEHRDRRKNFWFECAFWGWVLAGLVLCVVATIIWIDDEPGRTLDTAWDAAQKFLIYVCIGTLALWALYRLLKRLDKADKEIEWLNHMLNAVKNHAEDLRKGSIENFLELRDRLDKLEGKPPRNNTDSV